MALDKTEFTSNYKKSIVSVKKTLIADRDAQIKIEKLANEILNNTSSINSLKDIVEDTTEIDSIKENISETNKELNNLKGQLEVNGCKCDTTLSEKVSKNTEDITNLESTINENKETLTTALDEKLNKEDAKALYQAAGSYATEESLETAKTELNNKIDTAAWDITKISSDVVNAQDSINTINKFIEGNKVYCTIKSVPANGAVYEGTTINGKSLKKKDTLLVSKDGIQYVNGLGQINFTIKMNEGYKEVVKIDDTDSFKNIKTTTNTDGSITYKITKIKDELNINIGEEVITEEPNAYHIDFKGEHFSVKVLSVDKDLSETSLKDPEKVDTESGIIRTYSRDYDNGGIYAKYTAAVADDPETPDIDETVLEVKPQIQFILNPEEGYTIKSVSVSGDYKNDKSYDDATTGIHVYKYTVIKGDLEITVITDIAAKTLADYYITDAYTKTEVDKLIPVIPALPTTAGKYSLVVTVDPETNVVSYSWELNS